jgi:hypothetical protein
MQPRFLLLLPFLLLPLSAPAATPGSQGFANVHACVMQNDPGYCHTILTPNSYDLFDRFVSYKLMPCLPTDFAYISEEHGAARTMVKTSMQAGGGQQYILRLVFADTTAGEKLDIPASLERGFGEKWQDKIQLAEQLYLLMRQNMGDKLTCDMLNDLIKPQAPAGR